MSLLEKIVEYNIHYWVFGMKKKLDENLIHELDIQYDSMIKYEKTKYKSNISYNTGEVVFKNHLDYLAIRNWNVQMYYLLLDEFQERRRCKDGRRKRGGQFG